MRKRTSAVLILRGGKAILISLKIINSDKDIMSRTSKPQTASSKVSKPVPTQWRDRLAPEDYEELRQTFEVFDEDGSGTIDPPEINKVLEELGVDRRSPYVLRIINGLKEKSKPITFDEFVDIAAGQIG